MRPERQNGRCEVMGLCGSNMDSSVEAVFCARGTCFFWGSMGVSTVLSSKVTGCEMAAVGFLTEHSCAEVGQSPGCFVLGHEVPKFGS